MSRLERALFQLHADLRELGARWAVVGGVAVSARARPRTTIDIDVAVAVASDREAETLIGHLRQRGYTLQRILEQEATGRLAGARLVAAPSSTALNQVLVPTLFARWGGRRTRAD